MNDTQTLCRLVETTDIEYSVMAGDGDSEELVGVVRDDGLDDRRERYAGYVTERNFFTERRYIGNFPTPEAAGLAVAAARLNVVTDEFGDEHAAA